MRFNPNDANRFPSPGNWLAEILAIIKADKNFSPPGKIINEAKKPALFMSNKLRYEPGQVENLVKFTKRGTPQINPHKGPLMDVVVRRLEELKKYKPGAERRFVRNAILQDFRMAEQHHTPPGQNQANFQNLRGNREWVTHTKYGNRFIDSMRNLSKSRSLLGLGALAGVGIMAMGNMGNEA